MFSPKHKPMKRYPVVSFITSFLLACAFILFLLVSLSLPIIKPIYLLVFKATTIAPQAPLSIATELRFGIWGVCASSLLNQPTLTTNPGTCYGPQLGYTVPAYLSTAIAVPQPIINALQHTLLLVLILHPITAALTLIAFFFSLFLASKAFSVFTLIWLVFTALVVSASVGIDVALVLVAKREVDKLQNFDFEIVFGNAVWMAVGGLVLVWLAVVVVSARACYCCGVHPYHDEIHDHSGHYPHNYYYPIKHHLSINLILSTNCNIHVGAYAPCPKHPSSIMPFGEIVIGSPGSGKSTYCHGKHQFFTALSRPISIINLDPANDLLPYPCAIDIADLITLKDAMHHYDLGPNGGLIYCMEYLEKNYDWLEERLRELGEESWVMFDFPGQVELSTNEESVKRLVGMLQKSGFRLVATHLCDAHYITDATKYISVLLLSLRTMLQLELPHINVLSKIDILASYGDLDFNLDFYTEVQDLTYLQNLLQESLPEKFTALNMAMISLIEDFSLVGFETLAVEDKESMLHLMRVVDRASGYVFVPPPTAPAPPSTTTSTPSGIEEIDEEDESMQRVEKEEADRQRR
ncbi:hypothetical protein CVT24_007503, partial [Panaeolus cyanescens]